MTYCEALVEKLYSLAIDEGNLRAMVEIMDRVEGKVPQAIQHAGSQGYPVPLPQRSSDETDRMLIELLAHSAANSPVAAHKESVN